MFVPLTKYRSIVGLVALLVVIFVSLMISGYIWLKVHKKAYVEDIRTYIEKEYACALEADTVDIRIFPAPAAIVSNAVVRKETVSLSLPYVIVEFDWSALLHAEIKLARVSLIRPVFKASVSFSLPSFNSSSPVDDSAVDISLPQKNSASDAVSSAAAIQILNLLSSAKNSQLAEISEDFSLPDVLECAFDISEGIVEVSDAEKKSVIVSGIDSKVYVNPPYGIDGKLLVGSIQYSENDVLNMEIRDVVLELQGNILRWRKEQKIRVGVGCTADLLPTVLPPLAVSLAFRKTNNDSCFFEVDIKNSPADSSPLFPVSGAARFHLSTDGIVLDKCSLLLDQDEVSVQGAFIGHENPFSLFKGHVSVKKFSLPRWFSFARELPDGLQHTLDNISGEIDFIIDEVGLRTENLDVMAGGSRFLGKIIVPDFKKPEICLEAETLSADLATIFPESIGNFYRSVPFSLPPLLPLSYKSLSVSPSQPLGYNIRLKTHSLSYGPFTAQDVDFSVSPQENRVKLSFLLGKCYAGRVKGSVLVGDSGTGLPFNADVSFQGVQGEKLSSVPVCTSLYLPDGKLDATLTLSAQSGSLKDFLRSLNASLSVSSAEGVLRIPVGEKAIQKISHKGVFASFSVNRAELVSKKLKAAVKGKADIVSAWGTLHTQYEGGFSFSAESVNGEKIAVNAQLMLPPSSMLSKALSIQTSGTAAFDNEKHTFSYTKSSIAVNGAVVTGNWNIGTEKGKRVWLADVHFETRNLKNILKNIAINLPETRDASVFAACSIDAKAKLTDGVCSMSNIRAKLGNTGLTGDLSCRVSPFVMEGNLQLDTLSLDSWLSPKQKKSASSHSSWNLSFLDKISVLLNISINNLHTFKTQMQNVRIPLKINSSHVDADVHASLYGGSLRASLQGRSAGNKLSASLDASVQNCDMAQASGVYTSSAYIGGNLSGKIYLSADMRGFSDIPSKLGGTWNFSLHNGYFGKKQSKDRKGSQLTRFMSFSSSGNIDSGVLHTSSLNLKADSFTARGALRADLNNESLSGSITVDKPPFPEIPVSITGTISQPGYSVRAGKIISDGLENLGSGLWNMVGDVFDNTLRLLQ